MNAGLPYLLQLTAIQMITRTELSSLKQGEILPLPHREETEKVTGGMS